jgi:hypothetical protein
MDEQYKIGMTLAARFKISRTRDKMFKTSYGKKTAYGLFEMFMDITTELKSGEIKTLM